MRPTMLLCAAALVGSALALPAKAGEHDHVATAGSLRIVHAWARAAKAGDETLVFMEIENAGAPDRLTGGETTAAGSVAVVGLTLAGAEISVAEIGPVEVPEGKLVLDPGGVALGLRGLKQDLDEGADFDLTLAFEQAGTVTVDVEVEAADARQHGHAGHAH